MEPCFNVYQVDNNRFRGSLAGLGFAYCDFVRRDGACTLLRQWSAAIAAGGVNQR
jgi:hypothetical protein